jgi:hypothetical protein
MTVVSCPLCLEWDWFDDCDDDDDEDIVFEICELCFAEDGIYYVIEDIDVVGYLQDVYLDCPERFLREADVA